MTTSPPLLRASLLECQRGESVLFSGISFDLAEGEVLQVGGANGTGKTSGWKGFPDRQFARR